MYLAIHFYVNYISLPNAPSCLFSLISLSATKFNSDKEDLSLTSTRGGGELMGVLGRMV